MGKKKHLIFIFIYFNMSYNSYRLMDARFGISWQEIKYYTTLLKAIGMYLFELINLKRN